MNIDKAAAEVGMSTDLVAALTAAVAQWNPAVHRESHYVAIRPPERNVAAYFNRAHVDIVVDPLKAQATTAAYPGTWLLPKKSSAAAYVRVPTGTLPIATVVDLVGTALAWREQGSRWSGPKRRDDR